MGRGQYKNTSNNRKTNMTPPESRESTPARHEHPNTEEAKESNLKNNFMQMIENLREEIRKSFREMEEKTNQKMQEIKESQENKIKQLKETYHGLKTESETIKKTQTEGMLEVEKVSKQSGTTDASITNRIQELEDRISDAKDKLEEINSSGKENLKSNKTITQNIQEIWDTVKRPNLRIIGIEENEETFTRCRKDMQQNHRRKLSQPKERHANKSTRSLQNAK
ncbi:GTPase IMAP family member 3-like protein [Cricetulus griseus]|nr:GTPase IMAP family member 3-like protein [Cricetulus griseus]